MMGRRSGMVVGASAFGRVSSRERRDADLFLAELLGVPTRRRSRKRGRDEGLESALESAAEAAYDPQFKALELSPSSAHGGTRMSTPLTLAMLTAIMPKLATASAARQQRYLDLTNDTFRIYRIDTIESRSFFLAHAFIESGQFSVMMEADFREPYRARVRNASDSTWRPQHVTAAQNAEYRAKGYHNNSQIAPGGVFKFIGRGPLQVTTFLGYKRAAEVMNVWGQALGQGGAIDDASRVLHAMGEVSSDPFLAAIPELAFLHSGAHFKAARRPGTRVLSMDKSATSAPPLTPVRFLAASGSMFGVGSIAGLKAKSQSTQKAIIDNLNAKLPVFYRAVRTLCAGGTAGICANPALTGPVPTMPFPLP